MSLDFKIEKIPLSIETEKDIYFTSIKVSCYRDAEELLSNALSYGTTFGEMDIWVKYNSKTDVNLISNYKETIPMDKWIDLEDYIFKVDILIVFDYLDPTSYEYFLPSLIGRKSSSPID